MGRPIPKGTSDAFQMPEQGGTWDLDELDHAFTYHVPEKVQAGVNVPCPVGVGCLILPEHGWAEWREAQARQERAKVDDLLPADARGHELSLSRGEGGAAL
eukprot:1623221-Rhodomonas_salina.1